VIKVHEGGTYYCKEITPTVQAIFKGQATTMVLNEKEKAILKGICHEQTSKEIAEELFLSPNTVETYRKAILQKMRRKGRCRDGFVCFEEWYCEAVKSRGVTY
jgi:DNA-binding NarL/FixJ family response regulator